MSGDILIVDDERDIRTLVSVTLEDEGFTTIEASNAKEAREHLVSHPPSCVILDIWMRDSDMDGLELLSWCRSLFGPAKTSNRNHQPARLRWKRHCF